MNIELRSSSEESRDTEEMEAYHDMACYSGRTDPPSCSKFNRSDTTEVQIRVYQGGLDGHQVGPFKAAFQDQFATLREIVAPRTLTVIFMTMKDVCDRKWTIPILFDWLLGGSVHFVLTHPHQGFKSHNRILDMNEVMFNLMRLAQHTGFPRGPNLYCPVLTQDKYRYIALLEPHSIPTIKIYVPRVYNGESICRRVLGELER